MSTADAKYCNNCKTPLLDFQERNLANLGEKAECCDNPRVLYLTEGDKTEGRAEVLPDGE